MFKNKNILIIYLILFVALVFFKNVDAFSIEEINCNPGIGNYEYLILSGVSVNCQVRDDNNKNEWTDTSLENGKFHILKDSGDFYKSFFAITDRVFVKCGSEEKNEICGFNRENSTSSSDSGSNTSSSPSLVENYTKEDSNTEEIISKPEYTAFVNIRDNILFSGVSYNFEIGVNKYHDDRNTNLLSGIFKVNFGDGTYKEFKKRQNFSYSYDYPGEYVLVFEYYSSWIMEEANSPNIVFRKVIKVISPEIIIKSLSSGAGIIFENNTGEEIDLSNWYISFNDRKFRFALNTILLPNSKLTFSEKVLNLGLYPNAKNIYLLSPKGKVISSSIPEKVYKKVNNYASPVVQEENNLNKVDIKDESKDFESFAEDFENIYEYSNASVLNTDIRSDDKWLWVIIAILLFISFLVALLRKNLRKGEKEITKEFSGDINDDDITILE